MAHSNNEAINSLWQGYSGRSARLTRAIGQEIALCPEYLATPKGKDNQIWGIGDKVVTTGLGTIKAGISLEVTDVMLINGYYRYYAGGVWHNTEDLKGQDR